MKIAYSYKSLNQPFGKFSKYRLTISIVFFCFLISSYSIFRYIRNRTPNLRIYSSIIFNDTINIQDATSLISFRDWYDSNWRKGEPVIIAQSTTTNPFYIFVYSPQSDQYTSGEILQKGTWHPKLINLMEKFILVRKNNGLPTNILDIGANLGYFSLSAASLSANVYSIEASPLHSQMLKASIVFNKYTNINLFNVAVASEPSDKPLVLCENGSGNRAGTMITDKTTDSKDICVEVRVSTVDNILHIEQNTDLEIDFIKMDIEGYEPYALAGAKKLFERHIPSLIILEYNTLVLKESSTWAVNLLDYGYTAFDWYTSKSFKPTEKTEFKNFLDNLKSFVPSGHTDISFALDAVNYLTLA